MEKNYKILIITTPQLAAGYRLTGIDVEEVQTAQEADNLLEGIVASGRTYGIVGIDEDLYNAFSEKVMKKIDEWGVPLVVPLPSGALYRWGRKQREEDYASSLIQNAIGYQIKINK